MKVHPFLLLMTAALLGCAHKPIPVAQGPVPSAVSGIRSDNPVVKTPDPRLEIQSLIAEAFRPVYFPYDRSELTDTAKALLGRVGELLKRERDVTVLIEGNTDERGTDGYNLALGERRASVVKAYLVSYGIEGSRLRLLSYGEEHPASTGHLEKDWAMNRRDDFKVDF